MKNNKKMIFSIGIILIIAICVGIYFKPMTMSDITNDNSTLLFTKVNLGVKDGEPYHESEDYNDITDEQKQEILQILNDYNYSRNIKTLFSDGSMSDNDGEGYFYITIYNETDYQGTVIVAYDDEISFNNTNYNMKNSSDFIEEILDIISE